MNISAAQSCLTHLCKQIVALFFCKKFAANAHLGNSLFTNHVLMFVIIHLLTRSDATMIIRKILFLFPNWMT